MILHIENPKDAVKNYYSSSINLVKLQDTKDKALTDKNLLHYTIRKGHKEKVKRQFYLPLQQRIKYLRINLPKDVKELHSENYKILVKEIKGDTNKWRDIPCAQAERINTVKMTIPSKAIYGFSAIPNKLSMALFTESEQKIFQLV